MSDDPASKTTAPSIAGTAGFAEIELSADDHLREDLWTAIHAHTDVPALKVTEACAAAWVAIRKIIPLEDQT